jgi:hypothetical protein
VGVGRRFGDRVGDITINTLAGGFPDLVTLLISFLLEGGILGEEGCFFCAGCIFWRFVGGGVGILGDSL